MNPLSDLHLSPFVQAWLEEAFSKKDEETNSPTQGNAQSSFSSSSNLAHRAWRLFGYGSTRIEFANVFRPDGVMNRQMVASMGIPFFGRIATRFTLDKATNIPTAFHIEGILGCKAMSVGASLGADSENFIINYFTRSQRSITAGRRALTRIIIGSENVKAQIMGELKLYGSSLSASELGEALTFQIHRAHLKIAEYLVETQGPQGLERAVRFLQREYEHLAPHTDALKHALQTKSSAWKNFGLESLISAILGMALSELVPAGNLQHSLQNSVVYVVGSMWRGGISSLNFTRSLGAAAEGVPLTLIHSFISMRLKEVEKKHSIHLPQRRMIEDFAAISLYGVFKTITLRLLEPLNKNLTILKSPLLMGLSLMALGSASYSIYQFRNHQTRPAIAG